MRRRPFVELRLNRAWSLEAFAWLERYPVRRVTEAAALLGFTRTW